jgi:hypothetical protein
VLDPVLPVEFLKTIVLVAVEQGKFKTTGIAVDKEPVLISGRLSATIVDP